MSDLKTALETLGYRLSDNGDSWRTSAVYRSGQNSTSILIYKNTGVWYDYGQGIGPLPYRKLVELTAGTRDIDQFLVELGEFSSAPQNEFIEMSKRYPKSILDDLLPSYKFYLDKKIREDTLKNVYHAGFASGGKLYRRIVFPIFDEGDSIIGFSGRKIDNDNDAPKWKHLGKRREWVYPYYTHHYFSTAAVARGSNEMILVESIGDSLALSEHCMWNHLVLFGLTPSSKVISKLLEINPKRIIIATNNDLDSEINRGKLAAIKAYLSLLTVFDANKIVINLPLANDFGDMHEAGMDFNKWENSADQTQDVLAEGRALLKNPKAQFTKAQRSALEKL